MSHTVQPSFTGLHPHSVPAPWAVRLFYPPHRLPFLTPRTVHASLPGSSSYPHSHTAPGLSLHSSCHCIHSGCTVLKVSSSNQFSIEMSACRQSKTATRKQLFAPLLHGLYIPHHAAAGFISCAGTHSFALPSHTHLPTQIPTPPQPRPPPQRINTTENKIRYRLKNNPQLNEHCFLNITAFIARLGKGKPRPETCQKTTA